MCACNGLPLLSVDTEIVLDLNGQLKWRLIDKKTLTSCDYNEIINHYGGITLGGSKLRLQPHSVANPTKKEHAH